MQLADQVFLEIVRSKQWMNSTEIKQCQMDHQQSGGSQLLLDISKRRGYLNESQVVELKRSTNFMEIQREDEEIGQEVIKRGLAEAKQIAAILRRQKKLYESGNRIPRLLNALERRGMINTKQAFAIRHSFEEQSKSSGRFVFVKKDTKGTTERRSVDRRSSARFSLQDATIGVRKSRLLWFTKPSDSWRGVTLADLSPSGLQIVAPFKIKIGTRLHLAIEGQGIHRPIRCKAVVRWTKNKSSYSYEHKWRKVRINGNVQWTKHQYKEKNITYRAGLQFTEVLSSHKIQLKSLANKVLQSNITAKLRRA